MKLPRPSENLKSRLPSQKVLDLTPSEWKVLLHVADDLTTAEIAEKLCLTPKSVENYRTRIGAKLELTGRHKLAKFARKYVHELEGCYQQHLQKLPPPEIEFQTGATDVPIKLRGFSSFSGYVSVIPLTQEKAPRQFGDRTRGFEGVQCFTIKHVKCNEKSSFHHHLLFVGQSGL